MKKKYRMLRLKWALERIGREILFAVSLIQIPIYCICLTLYMYFKFKTKLVITEDNLNKMNYRLIELVEQKNPLTEVARILDSEFGVKDS